MFPSASPSSTDSRYVQHGGLDDVGPGRADRIARRSLSAWMRFSTACATRDAQGRTLNSGGMRSETVSLHCMAEERSRKILGALWRVRANSSHPGQTQPSSRRLLPWCSTTQERRCLVVKRWSTIQQMCAMNGYPWISPLLR